MFCSSDWSEGKVAKGAKRFWGTQINFIRVLGLYITRGKSEFILITLDMSYGRPTTSQIKSTVRDLNGQGLDFSAQQAVNLAWSASQDNIVLSGSSDVTALSGLKGALLKLKQDFFSPSSGVVVAGDKKDSYDQRFLLLEHEIDGLLKRKINYTAKEGERVLDYTGILNEKENQIVELEKKIQNLEERLRRASLRENELENEIVRLKSAIKALNNPSVSRGDLEQILIGAQEYRVLDDKYNKLKNQLSTFNGMLRSQGDKLRSSGINFGFESSLSQLLTSEGLDISVVNGIAHVIDYKEKIVEVPVQDARTKHLIHLLSSQMKKYVDKYPKLRDECDERLTEFFSQEIIDMIEADDFERVISIVKYVPDIYRVENVYAYSSEKSRKVEFHLRVLIKALLEELEKLKKKTGAVLDIDEGVIGMINAEIMGVIDVDDILKVFRVVPKIVEVEKVVEKIVDRVIEVPQVVVIERAVEKPVEVVKVQEVEKIVHVPVEVVKVVDNVIEKVVEVPQYTEKLVEVPRIIEKVVERVVQIPKVVEVTVVEERVVEVEKPVVVEKIVNHTVPEIREIEIIKEKIVPVEKIVREVVEVPIVKEKIVEKVVEVIKPFDRIVEKPVEIVKYKSAKETVNQVVSVPQIVEVIVEKPVPIIQTIEKVVEVPKTIEKIVQVQVEKVEVKEVRVVEEKIVYKDRIKEVEKIVNHNTTLRQEVEKIVDRRVEVPIVQEKIVRVPEIVTQIVVERAEVPKIVEVVKNVDKIVEVNKIIEVEKPVNHFITQNNPVKVVVEKVVEVPRTVERIKEVRVNIDKIIEKMVEVPKVVEVEKLVEKVVVVPRVIEKIVEVPQIIEKVVDRVVEVEKVREVQKLVQVPIVQDKIVEVEKVVNIYNEVDRVVERVVEKVVPLEKTNEIVKVVEQPSEKVVEVRVEVPKEIKVDRIVPKVVEVEKVVEIEKPTIVPVEVPVPVDKIIQVVVPVDREVEKIVQVVQEVENIVQVKVEDVRVEQIMGTVEKPVIQERIKEVEKVTPYYNEVIKEVQTRITEPVVQYQDRIVEVPTVLEKLVTLSTEVPKVYEIQQLEEKVVQVPHIVELPVEIPVVCKVNSIVQEFRDRPVEIPILHQEVKEVHTIEQKVVAVERRDTEVKEIVVNRDKVVESQKYVERENVRNVIETRVQSVPTLEEKVVPVYSTQEKVVEVPYLLEKIVEKIVVMPQVVEVLKYVHEIVEEETLGVAVGADVNMSQVRYKELYGQVRTHFEALLVELRKMRVENPNLKVQIEIIETFLTELDKIIQFPRFYQVEKEKIVEKEVNKPVLVPTATAESIKTETSYAVLIDKLISEIKRIKSSNNGVRLELDEDIQLMFFSDLLDGNKQLRNLSPELGSQLRSYKESQKSKLYSLGKTWSNDHELMLNTILDERFTMANLLKEANLQVEKSKSIANQRGEANKILRQNFAHSTTKLENLERELGIVARNFENNPSVSGELRRIFTGLDEVRGALTVDPKTLQTEQIVFTLGDIHGSGDGFIRLQSAFRALERENQLLKDKYVKWQKTVPNAQILSDKERIIENLSKQIASLTTEISTVKSQPSLGSVKVDVNAQEYEIRIRTLNSRIQELESQLRTQKVDYDGQIRQKNNTIRELEDKLASLTNSSTVSVSVPVKVGESTATRIGDKTPNLTDSQHSNSSGSNLASSYSVSNSGVSSSSNVRSYGQTGTNPAAYGATGTSSYAVSSSSSSSSNVVPSATNTSVYRTSSYGTTELSGSGVRASGTGATYGTATTSNYQVSGATGVTGGATLQSGTSATYGSSSGVRYSSSTSGAGNVTGASISGSTSGTGTTYTPYSSYYNKK